MSSCPSCCIHWSPAWGDIIWEHPDLPDAQGQSCPVCATMRQAAHDLADAIVDEVRTRIEEAKPCA